MRHHRGHPCDPSPEEAASDALDAFDLEETQIALALSVPGWAREGIASGRMRYDGRRAVRFHRRLALRHLYRSGPMGHGAYNGWYIVLRRSERVVRLPFG